MTDGNLIDIDDLPERLRRSATAESFIDDKFLSLDEVQRRRVLQLPRWGNQARAAEILGIGRATIHRFLLKMKLEGTLRRERVMSEGKIRFQ